jgi:putative transposase
MPETANGPDDALTWEAVNWAVHEQNVARLRRRIFTAARDGDLAKARNLQPAVPEGACLRRMRGNAHVRCGGEGGAAMRRPYPTGTALRERGLRKEAAEVMQAALTDLAPLSSKTTACRILGISRATLHRRENPAATEREMPAGPRVPHPAALSEQEREQVLDVLDSDRFADKSPAQAWAVLLDEGSYYCSIRTMYRVLESRNEVRERRAQAAHPPRVRPELVADGPDQVWTWDITKLRSQWRGLYFDLYVMMDIFSRKVVRQEVHVTENGDLAKAFIENAIAANGGARPDYIHADNGTSMTSKPVSQLLSDLNIADSHSRPHVSNDNPYSEAAFKTLKYCPVFPGNFESVGEARTFCSLFFGYYNNEHRHSGIGLNTPQSVHDGTWRQIRERRQQVLDAAYAARPDRFRGRRPLAPDLPARVWINQPRPTIQSQETAGINQAA